MRILLGIFFFIFIESSVMALEVNDQAVTCSASIGEKNKLLDLNKYRGKVIYLDFWATWCPPCMKSMPFLNTLRNELVEKGFEIIAINVDDDSNVARQFLQKHPIDYLVAMDPYGECPAKYDVKAMPSAYFIDRQGTIRYIHLGFRESDEKDIRKLVLELLAEKKDNNQ